MVQFCNSAILQFSYPSLTGGPGSVSRPHYRSKVPGPRYPVPGSRPYFFGL
jgi:hypothetical protein